MKLNTIAGFTAIEAVVAIFILSTVGLMIGETLLRTSHSATRSQESQKAAALSDMVLEQYTAYAARDYANLASYDQDSVTPQVFFGARDNLGYDRLRITTRARPQDNGGSLVMVKISWGGGSPSDSLTFTKTYAESTGDRTTTSLSGI